MVSVISVVGRSDVGKTTFLEKVVKELKDKGYRVAVIKHDTHGFEIDHPGKDSWRMTQAGSDVVVISSADKMAMIKKTSQELSLDQLEAYIMGGVDIILAEGYKSSDKPKIEISRADVSDELLCTEQELLALVTDQHFDLDVPQFALDDVRGVVEFLIENVLGQQRELEVFLSVNGNPVGIGNFVRSVFTNTILGLVASLHGTENARDIRITIRLP